MRRFARQIISSFALMISACNPGESPAIANTPNGPAAPQGLGGASGRAKAESGMPAIAKGIPHGSVITEVAITEQADAALSFDNLLGIRLWPSLDGTRPPVAVTAIAPRQLALAHAGRDLLAVILEDAGTVQALRLGLDGAVHGHATLPGQYEQALAIEGGIIARTADHAIEWYAADGTPRGRVVAPPGQQIHGIATRNGHTAALLADATTDTARTIRWLTLGDMLGWGMSVEVPGPVVDGMFAISPNNKRVAYASLAAVEVYEIDPFPRVVPGKNVLTHGSFDRGIGFIDDDHVVLANNSEVGLWSPAKPQPEAKPANPDPDPWAVSTTFVRADGERMSQPIDRSLLDGFAYGNGLVVRGQGVTLVLSTELSTRYLGWKQLASGNLANAGEQIVMGLSASRYVWLDNNLEVKRDAELHETATAPWVYAIPIDENHVITQTSRDTNYDIAFVDLEHQTSTTAITFRETERLEYSPDARLFAVSERHRLNRYRIDVATHSMTALTPIRIKGSPLTVRLFDPIRAGGITAAVIGWDNEYANNQTLTIYRDKGTPTRIHPFEGTIMGEKPDGTIYAFSRTTSELQVLENGKVTRTAKLEGASIPSMSPDASRIAYIDAKGAISMRDADGNELWKLPMFGAQQVLFTADGKKLVVRAIGGVITFDATTGIRTGLECGWNFGVYDEQPISQPPGQPVVCEDPMLQ